MVQVGRQGTALDQLLRERQPQQPPPPPPRAEHPPGRRGDDDDYQGEFRSQTRHHIREVEKFEVIPGYNMIIIDQLERWRFSIEAQFRRARITRDKDKMDYMPEALRGVAKDWLMTHVRTGQINLDTTTWEEFLSMLEEHFIPISPDEVDRARYKVLTIPDKIREREVVEFSQRFAEAATKVGDLSQAQQMFDYLQALKKGKLKMHLHGMRGQFKTVHEVIKAACAYNNLRNTAYVLGGGGSLLGDEGGGSSGHSGPQPMEVNAMRGRQEEGDKGQRRGGGTTPSSSKWSITAEEWKRRKEKRLCFSCGADDHLGKDCPSKEKEQKLATASLPEKGESSEEDEDDQ
jgi:hypothetical protein